jgi:hypothetical protein
MSPSMPLISDSHGSTQLPRVLHEEMPPLVHDSGAALNLKVAALFMSSSWTLVYIVSSALKQEHWWPLANISQYAAHYPSVYFFRAASTASGVLVAQAGLRLRPHGMRWWPVLPLAGVCLVGVAVVSCEEDNKVHLGFAFMLFILFGIAEACASRDASTYHRTTAPAEHFKPGYLRPGVRVWPRLLGLGSLSICFSLALVVGTSFGNHASIPAKAQRLMVSCLEWAMVCGTRLELAQQAQKPYGAVSSILPLALTRCSSVRIS